MEFENKCRTIRATLSFLHTIEEAEVLNQNEFDSFDNYNLNLLLIRKYSARRIRMEAKMKMR